MRPWPRTERRWTLFAIRWVFLAAFLISWQLVGSSGSRAFFFYSTPTAIGWRLLHEIEAGDLAGDALKTCVEVGLGLTLGSIVGSISGLLLWWFREVGQALRPIVIALASVPVFAIAPLLVLWFGVGLLGKIMVVALSIFFMILLATYQSAVGIEEEFWEVASCARASRSRFFLKVVLRGSLILSASAYKLAVSFGFVGAFIAEWISSSSGVGHFIQRSASLYDVSSVFAGLFVFALCALGGTLVLDKVDRHVSKWK